MILIVEDSEDDVFMLQRALIGPVMTRLETFLSPKPIRYMVSQAQNRLDFAHIIDTGKIFLAKLSQGAIGKENSYLLGSLLMAKFQQIAMSRQNQQESKRRNFWLYLDEFQNFITPSTSEILTGARKYHLALTLAHQELHQLQRDPEVASAVLTHPYTRICFRLGDQDAKTLANGFTSFDARDLQNLSTGRAVCRVERAAYDFNLTVAAPKVPEDDIAAVRRHEVISASRARYATPRAEVEASLWKQLESIEQPDIRSERPRAKERPQTPIPPPNDRVVSSPPPASPTRSESSAASLTPQAKIAPVAANSEHVANGVPSLPTGSSVVSSARNAVNQVPQIPGDPTPKTTSSTTEWGRGGKQHEAILRRIKEAAKTVGFRVAVEDAVPGGAGSVDVVLSRTDMAIAYEVTITNTIDYEVGNVAKCIKAGFKNVVVVGVTADKLKRLETAVLTGLGSDVAAHVKYFLPDQFIAYVEALPAPTAPEATERVSRGYKIKRSYPQLAPDEAKAREDAGVAAIAASTRSDPKR